MSIAIIIHMRVKFVVDLTFPVIAGQVLAFVFLGFILKSDSSIKDDFVSVKHQRWLYVWTFQFITILYLLTWFPCKNCYKFVGDWKNRTCEDILSKACELVREKKRSCCHRIFHICSLLPALLYFFSPGIYGVYVTYKLFNGELNILQCVLFLAMIFLLIFVIITRRLNWYLLFLVNAFFVFATTSLSSLFLVNISPKYVSVIRDIISFPFLAFTIVKCFSCCKRYESKTQT